MGLMSPAFIHFNYNRRVLSGKIKAISANLMRVLLIAKFNKPG